MSALEGAKIEDLLRDLGEDPLLREAEAMGLAPRGRRMRCPWAGCADKKLGDRERDAQLYAGHHPRILCYRCSAKGDLVDLLERSRGWSRAEAIAHLTGLPPPKPALHVVASPEAQYEDAGKLLPAEVQQLWDGMVAEDEAGRRYLEGRGLDGAQVRFATDGHPNKTIASQARRGYRVAALLLDVTGNPRGIQFRMAGEPRGDSPKVLSARGSATGRAFFGRPDLVEAEGVVAVAEGLADTLALRLWVGEAPGVAVVGAAGKDMLHRLADELAAAGVPLQGKRFALFPQNDRPSNKSRRAFTRLAQKLTALGADITWCSTPEELKDVAVWFHSQPELEWPPPELARALLPEPGDDASREAQPVLPGGCAIAIPARVEATLFAQNFTTLCALLDDPAHREQVCGRGELTWCEMTHAVRLGGLEVTETDLSSIRLGLEGAAKATDGKPLKFGEDDIAKALKMLARRRTVHPVRAWLSGLTWDEHQRLDAELPRALGHEPGTFAATLLRRWVLSAVARPMSPGCKVDTVLVLVGPQSAGKSTFFSVLAGDEWFTDSPVQVNDVSGKQLMRKKWIVEWAELDSMRRAKDKEAIRAFLTQRIDEFREPYGRAPITAPRGCVIVGTSNDQDFLQEYERRFFPICVEQVDLDWVRANRAQLWAEAVVRYQEATTCPDCLPLLPDRRCPSHRWWLERDELRDLAVTQEDYQRRHPWTELVEDWVDSKGAFLEITPTQVLIECLKKRDGEITNRDQQEVGQILRSMGWERQRRSRGGKPRWVYVRREEG